MIMVGFLITHFARKASVVRRVDEYLFLEGEDVRARIGLT